MPTEKEILELELNALNSQKISIDNKKIFTNSNNFISDKVTEINSFINNINLGISMKEHLIQLRDYISNNEENYKTEQIQNLNNALNQVNIRIQEISNRIEEII